MTEINRRKFLKLAGATLGISAVGCCGLGTVATYQPQVNFVEDRIKGEDEMKQRILVTYASKAGSTSEVAAAIGKSLAVNGTAVDVLPVEDVANVQDYQGVVIGSAIRAGQWVSSATNFVESNQSILSQIPTAFFTCCMTLYEESEENRQKALGYMVPVKSMVEPVSIGAFAGKLDYSKISFLDSTIMKIMGTPEGDYRNWKKIENWANQLQPALIG